MDTGPPPYRPITSLSLTGPGSKFSTTAAPAASRAMRGLALENMWRVSSSGTPRNRMGRRFQPTAWSAFRTYRPITSPAFMSSTPGPWAFPSSSTRKGFLAASPAGNTVSIWPMNTTGFSLDPGFQSPTIRSPAWSTFTRRTRAPAFSSSRWRMSPTRFTPSSCLGPLSVLTISAHRSSISCRFRSIYSFSCASVASIYTAPFTKYSPRTRPAPQR